MVLDCTFRNCGDSAIYLHRRRGSHASVELAAAAAVRMEGAYVLAGAGIAGAVPDLVRRTWRPSSWTRLQTSLGRTLQEDDAGGAGKIPSRHGGRVRLRRIDKPERRKLDSLHRMSSFMRRSRMKDLTLAESAFAVKPRRTRSLHCNFTFRFRKVPPRAFALVRMTSRFISASSTANFYTSP